MLKEKQDKDHFNSFGAGETYLFFFPKFQEKYANVPERKANHSIYHNRDRVDCSMGVARQPLGNSPRNRDEPVICFLGCM